MNVEEGTIVYGLKDKVYWEDLSSSKPRLHTWGVMQFATTPVRIFFKMPSERTEHIRNI